MDARHWNQLLFVFCTILSIGTTAVGQAPFVFERTEAREANAPEAAGAVGSDEIFAPVAHPMSGDVVRFLSDEGSAAQKSDPKKPDATLESRIKALEEKQAKAEAAKNKLPSVTVNGVFQADAVMFGQTDASVDQFGDIENGAGFRRARLSAKGAAYEKMNYMMQMDFGFFGRPTFTDVWVEQTEVPILGNVRVGQWKQPFGLETVSSFRYTTFMERSSLFQSFVPFRHIGIGFYDHASDLNSTWALSYLRTGQDQFGNSLSTSGGNGLAGRATRLLWYEGEGGCNYLHLGGGYYLNSPPRDTVRFRSIPEMFVGEFAPGAVGTSGQAVPGAMNGTPFFVDSGALGNVHRVDTFGTELLWVHGPWSMQGEAMGAVVSRSGVQDAFLGGAYAQVGYFLTGEHRPYDRKAGAIDRVLPRASFGKNGGLGAWEVASRWSFIDLDDQQILGGTMQNMTHGLNWYINPYCKFVFNYIHSWVEGRDRFPTLSNRIVHSQTDSFAMRVQLDF